jgi:zinc protease
MSAFIFSLLPHSPLSRYPGYSQTFIRGEHTMKNTFTIRIFLLLFSVSVTYTEESDIETNDNLNKVHSMNQAMSQDKPQSSHVAKRILSNGMTVLARVVRTIPKVSLQIWYKVGSKDEKTGEKGIAHFIEHMIFKGTDILSESDINDITHMFSGSCNAFTAHDFTGYLFNMPTQHWKTVVPIMADCMEHVRFDENMLSSEMKAVIQELKMDRDNYKRSLIEELISVIFTDHPYHYPIIGFKQDLWGAKSDLLRAFYKKHYYPNNATLVVVGDIDPEDVFAYAEEQFGHIQPNPEYQKETFYFNKDIASKSVTLYRDIQQPLYLVAYVVPGVRAKQEAALTALKWVLGKGRSSRLQKKLIDELQLVTSLQLFIYGLFEHGLLCIVYEPKRSEDVPAIENYIEAELQNIINQGVTTAEAERAINNMRMQFYGMLEDMEFQASTIGEYFTATGDEQYAFENLDIEPSILCAQIQQITREYLRPVYAHHGAIKQLPSTERDTWQQAQQVSDLADEAILSAHVRTTEVEPSRYAKTLKTEKPAPFTFPHATTTTLSNGMTLLYYNNPNTPMVTINLLLRVRHYYDPEETVGIGNFVASMLTEGTTNYTAEEFAQALESRGMSLATSTGLITSQMLKQDVSFGLEIIKEVVTDASFNAANIEKVRAQLDAAIKSFWDEPNRFAGQLIKEHIYADHPYHKMALGNRESVGALTEKELRAYYQQYMSPDGATIVVVGDLGDIDIKQEVEKVFGSWHGPRVQEYQFPELHKPYEHAINFPINRDQVVLALGKRSINRLHPDYDALLLFNQIFGGGELGSMSSRLFQLREQTGLFYTIYGSLTAGADEQPGMCLVTTVVSRDRLAEAEEAIKKEIQTAAQSITQEELEEAKRAVIHTMVDHFASNSDMANAFLFLHRFKLSENYFDKRATVLDTITVADIQKAVSNIMRTDDMLTVRVGRVGETYEAKK